MLDAVIEKSLGIRIDGNIEVDFGDFIKAMGEVGELEIELTGAETIYLNTNGTWAEQQGIGDYGN